MPKRSILPIGELPVWHPRKSPRTDQLEPLHDETVTAIGDSNTTKLLNQQIIQDQRTRELSKARMVRYRERNQHKVLLKKQKIRDSIRVRVPKSYDPSRQQRGRDLTRIRVARLRDRSQIIDSIKQQALEAEAQKR
jgi:hypothetical protein